MVLRQPRRACGDVVSFVIVRREGHCPHRLLILVVPSPSPGRGGGGRGGSKDALLNVPPHFLRSLFFSLLRFLTVALLLLLVVVVELFGVCNQRERERRLFEEESHQIETRQICLIISVLFSFHISVNKNSIFKTLPLRIRKLFLCKKEEESRDPLEISIDSITTASLSSCHLVPTQS